jgi:hypothetical protein
MLNTMYLALTPITKLGMRAAWGFFIVVLTRPHLLPSPCHMMDEMQNAEEKL